MATPRRTPADLLSMTPTDMELHRVVAATPAMTAGADDARARSARRFILQLARALHQHGTPAHRLEAALSTAARRLGLQAEFFSTPTSIMVGIGALEEQQVHLLRVEPGEPNLGQLNALGAITRDVVDGVITPDEGLRRIDALDAEPPTYPTWLVVVAFVLSSAAVACFLKVRTGDVATASVLGLLAGAIAILAGRWESTRHVTEPLAAFVVTAVAFLADAVLHTRSGYATSLAGLVVLFPGLTFTIALTELSTRHLASGTARLSGALVTFLGLGFGLALGAKAGAWAGAGLSDSLPQLAGLLSRAELPVWAEWAGLIVAPLAFTVLLNGPPRDAPLIVLACAVAYLTSKYAGAAMGEELGAFLGALVVTAGSNVLARLRRRVAMVTQVPGLLILVPGSIGFRSVRSLLDQQVEAGIATGFRVAIVGISLAAGMLAGNVVTRAMNRVRR
ncbi:MAG: threonine/serine exporter family protein [Gemmatimonadaceae bacterium]|nr:threonine/serine exporter family protein [Gemmatimonadaceae bacterium]